MSFVFRCRQRQCRIFASIWFDWTCMSCKSRMEKKAGNAGVYFEVFFKHLAHSRIVPLYTVQVRYFAFLGVHTHTHTHTDARFSNFEMANCRCLFARRCTSLCDVATAANVILRWISRMVTRLDVQELATRCRRST